MTFTEHTNSQRHGDCSQLDESHRERVYLCGLCDVMALCGLSKFDSMLCSTGPVAGMPGRVVAAH